MQYSKTRARVAIGSAVLVMAAAAAAGHVGATTEPPSPSDPGVETTVPGTDDGSATSAPAGSAPELDPQREALVDQIIASAEPLDIPFDRDCVAGIVAQVSEADLEIIAAQVAEPMTGETVAEVTASADSTVPAASEPVASEPMGSHPMVSEPPPVVSAEASALGSQLINCVHGDADPALVEQATELFAQQDFAADFDLTCVSNMFSTFDDAALQAIIDSSGAAPAGTEATAETGSTGGTDATAETDAAAGTDATVDPESPAGTEAPTDTAAAADASAPVGPAPTIESALEDSFLLAACGPMTTGSSVPMDHSASTETTTADTIAGTEPATETTEAG